MGRMLVLIVSEFAGITDGRQDGKVGEGLEVLPGLLATLVVLPEDDQVGCPGVIGIVQGEGPAGLVAAARAAVQVEAEVEPMRRWQAEIVTPLGIVYRLYGMPPQIIAAVARP